MLRVLIARLVIGMAAVGAGGSLAGLGLANYVESGSFHFYKQPRMTAWHETSGGFGSSSADPISDRSSVVDFAITDLQSAR